MAIESRSEVIQAPGLRKGVYVDPTLRSPRSDYYTGSSDVSQSGKDEINSIDLSAYRDDLKMLSNVSPSALNNGMNEIRQQFGLDAEAIRVEESLDGALDLDLDAAHASELALAGMVGAVRDNFKVTGVNGLSGSVRDASDAKVLKDAAKRQARRAKSGSIPCTLAQ